MIQEPKFKIGQSVFLKDDVDYYIACHNGKYDTHANPRPRTLTVIGIIIDICSGGTQIWYTFTIFTTKVAEIALISELPTFEAPVFEVVK